MVCWLKALPYIPSYQWLIFQIVFRLLTDTLSDNDGLQRNFWPHHNDCLMDTSLINCLILICSVSFVKADSRNDGYWHCWMSYMITVVLSSVYPRFPTSIFMCVYIYIFTFQISLETSLWLLFDFCALWYRQQSLLAVHLFAKIVLITYTSVHCILWSPANNC